MKYTVKFVYNEEDGVMDNDYIVDAIEFSLNDDVEQCMLVENIQDSNPMLSEEEEELLEYIENHYEEVNGKMLVKCAKILDDPYEVPEDELDFMDEADGTWYAVDIDIDTEALQRKLEDDDEQGEYWHAVIEGCIPEVDPLTYRDYNKTGYIYSEDEVYSTLNKDLLNKMLKDIQMCIAKRRCLLTEYLDFQVDEDKIYDALQEQIDKDTLRIESIFFLDQGEAGADYCATLYLDVSQYKVD